MLRAVQTPATFGSLPSRIRLRSRSVLWFSCSHRVIINELTRREHPTSLTSFFRQVSHSGLRLRSYNALTRHVNARCPTSCSSPSPTYTIWPRRGDLLCLPRMSDNAKKQPHPSKVVAHGLAGSTDSDVWCLDSRGVLTLAVSKHTYESLGLVGERLPWKGCEDIHGTNQELSTFVIIFSAPFFPSDPHLHRIYRTSTWRHEEVGDVRREGSRNPARLG